jgi:hypothetical protein
LAMKAVVGEEALSLEGRWLCIVVGGGGGR